MKIFLFAIIMMIGGLVLGYFLYNKKLDTTGKVIAVILAITFAYSMYEGWWNE